MERSKRCCSVLYSYHEESSCIMGVVLDLHLWPHPRYPALSPAIDQCAAFCILHVAFCMLHSLLVARKSVGCRTVYTVRSAGLLAPFTHSHRVRSLRPRSEVTARCARLGAWPRSTDVNVARSIRVCRYLDSPRKPGGAEDCDQRRAGVRLGTFGHRRRGARAGDAAGAVRESVP